MAYTTINKSTDNFNTKLWTGNDSAQSITGVGFQPDWTWIKCRSNGGNASFEHILTDAVRGVNKTLFSNSNSSEVTNNSVGYLSAFGSDGFTVTGQDATSGIGRTYVGWNWKANGTGSANTDGSINSTVSANTTAGFSIVTFQGTNTSGETVGHGLGVTPQIMISKDRDSAEAWSVHTTVIDGSVDYLRLAGTDAKGDSSFSAPTNTVFGYNPGSGGYVAYVFAEKTGYSKFGSYRGNGNADGTFVYTGFKPAFVMTKEWEGTSDWYINDTTRDFNGTYGNDASLLANTNGAEFTSSSLNVDMLSNGFKLRSANPSTNEVAGYIYMAFASAPLVGTNNVPCVAR